MIIIISLLLIVLPIVTDTPSMRGTKKSKWQYITGLYHLMHCESECKEVQTQ